jgi:hypothetical protein
MYHSDFPLVVAVEPSAEPKPAVTPSPEVPPDPPAGGAPRSFDDDRRIYVRCRFAEYKARFARASAGGQV